MLYVIQLIVKASIFVAVLIIIDRSKERWAALVASLPLVSVLSIMAMWMHPVLPDGRRLPAPENVERIARHSWGVLGYVMPSLVLFVVLPVLLRRGVPFWLSLGIACVVTIGAYVGTTRLVGLE